jgi:hypothetical protein
MKTTLIFLAAGFLLASCAEEKKPQKASTELVNITATADSSNMQDTSSQKKAIITFEKNIHNFGTITQGEVLEYAFIFKNTGNQDLIIADATASCGCTVPEYPKEPIGPGGEGRIKVKFNSEKRIDHFQKEIYVSANTNPVQSILVITGNVNKQQSKTKLPSH